MKFIVFILSICIGFQAFVPCSDGNTCDENAELQSSHDHSSDENDECTLFCVCSCCGTALSFAEDLDPNSLKLVIPNRDLPVLKDLYSFECQQAVWRPPAGLS